MKKILFPVLILALCSWQQPKSLKGTWKYVGGISNGKIDSATVGYTLQRQYDDNHFDAFILEPGQKPFKYQAGEYSLVVDTCKEKETFNAQSSALTGKTISYLYKMRKDTLVLSTTLPNGTVSEDHWKKIK